MNRQSGFTLIELVVVITILGILAAFALPRFTNIQTQARFASINALAGNLRAAAALAHAQWLAEGATNSITVEGNQPVVMEQANGYPTANTAGINAMLSNLDGYINPSDGVFHVPGSVSCQVTYSLGTGNNDIPDISVVTDDNQCN